jgi:hypothetical protein
MNLEDYERFKMLMESGLRSEAAYALQSFIASFSTFEEKMTWSRWFFENEKISHKIRFELYEQVIFPVLLKGYRERDPWALRWLARTAQNFYQSERLWNQLDGMTDYAILKDLVALCPNDDEARKDLLSCQLDWFRYCIHEWPAGILYGHNGATTEQCQEIIDEIAVARQMDQERLHTEFLADVENKVLHYIRRAQHI